MPKNTEKMTDKIVSAISYLTMGWGGLIYLIIMAFKRANLSRFVRYNILQSIFISFLYFILAMLFGFIFNLLSYIPYVNILIAKITIMLNGEFLFNYSVIQLIAIGILLYMALYALIGKYPRIYFVSQVIDKQIK